MKRAQGQTSIVGFLKKSKNNELKGRVLHTITDTSLQLEVLDILHKIVNRSEPVALDNVKLATCIRSLELSYLPESLADFLLVADSQIVEPLLNIILRICILSDYSCWGMLLSGIHETLLIRLIPSTVFKVDQISLETMDLTLQILWRLLSCTHKSEDWQLIKPLSKAALILILALGNFVWEVIVWHQPSALKFIQGGHVYYILDILELKNEKDYYSLLKSCHLTSALEAQRQILYIARTSNRQCLLQAKKKQMQQTKITNVENPDEIEKTYPHDINITTMNPGRTILLKYREPLVKPR